MILTIAEIARMAGIPLGADGKLNLPATQEVADALAVAARNCVLGGADAWIPGMVVPVGVTLTGAAPAWAYMCAMHGLHGIVPSVTYSAPNATIRVFGHGE